MYEVDSLAPSPAGFDSLAPIWLGRAGARPKLHLVKELTKTGTSSEPIRAVRTAGGQPLPGRILTCRVPSERFPLCQLLPTSLPPFPGLAWRTDLGTSSGGRTDLALLLAAT